MSDLKSTFEKLLGENAAVRDYSLPEEFKSLWEFEGMHGTKSILILWSQTPPDEKLDPVRAESCLSPLEWACCALKRSVVERVTILDLCPAANRETFLYTFHRSLRSGVCPSIRVLQAPDLFPNADSDDSLSAAGPLYELLFQDEENVAAEDGSSDGTPSNGEIVEDLKLFFRQIRSRLTESGPEAELNRHAITNVIGPTVLLGGKPALEDSFHAVALTELTRAAGLWSKPPTAPKWTDDDPIDAKGVKVWLVDDQAHHGWEQWLRTRIKFKNAEDLKVLRDPKPLLQVLTTNLETLQAEEDLRFRLFGDKNAGQDAIFLDLRLFGSDFDAECTFIGSLLPVARRFEEKSQGQWAWPGFKSLELDSIENWLKNPEKDNRNHLAALSLFPRLLALADLSVPIVIFSSTGQRDIVDKLKDYGNIITDFQKPRLFGSNTKDVSETCMAGLKNCLEKVERFAEVAKWLRCEGLTSSGILSIPTLSGKGPWKAVLYIDEFGSARNHNLSLGGILAIYPSQYDEWDLDQLLSRQFPEARMDKDFCREHLDDIFTSASSKLKKKEGMVFPIVVRSGREHLYTSLEEADELHDENVEDNLWRELFKRLVETAIYVVTRSAFPGGSKIQFSVRAPTRVVEVGGRDKKLLNTLWRRWGVGTAYVGDRWRVQEALDNLDRYGRPENLPQDTWVALLDLLRFELRKGYDLSLMSVTAPAELTDRGESLIIVALVDGDLHIRIFDANGRVAVDKPESKLVSGPDLNTLKALLNDTPFPDASRLSEKAKTKIIEEATSISGHTLRKATEPVADCPPSDGGVAQSGAVDDVPVATDKGQIGNEQSCLDDSQIEGGNGETVSEEADANNLDDLLKLLRSHQPGHVPSEFWKDLIKLVSTEGGEEIDWIHFSEEIIEPVKKIRWVGFDTPRPLVEGVMRDYRDSIFGPPADVVRAFLLNSHGMPGAEDIPVLHFLADGLMSRKGLRWAVRTGGLFADYGFSLESLLRANRRLARREMAEGLKEVFGEFKPVQDSSIEMVIWHLLAIEVSQITGEEYLSLIFERDPESSPGAHNEVYEGIVSQQNRDTRGNIYLRVKMTGRSMSLTAFQKDSPNLNFHSVQPNQPIQFSLRRNSEVGRFPLAVDLATR